MIDDDGNWCTADSCDPVVGVRHDPIPGCTQPPTNDPTVATDVASGTAFLYSGANPVQVGVAAETIEANRVAVIRGVVKGRGNIPIDGVTITILSHPEFGSTLTRGGGMFDMAVNGGGLLTVSYEKEGYLPAQRQVNTPWRDYVWADEVVLVPFDTQVTAVTAGAPAMQVASGSSVTDSEGTRTATILFPAGTQASMILSDGTTQALSTMNVRATEYTVGTDGPKAMPAALPPSSGYTYAVELSVDEAVGAGATSVQFDRPVSFYVENFLGFPVGGIVPVGYYDRTRGVWVPSPNGRVVGIVSTTGGLADLDINGDGQADDANALAALGVTDEERSWLADTHAPGTSLWRVPITHFSPWDCNWPYGCSDDNNDGKADCEQPNQPAPLDPHPIPEPCEQSGSKIECQNQVLGEEVRITGTPFTLHYRSDRVPARTAESTIRIALTGASIPSNVRRIDLEVMVAGRRFNYSFPPLASQTYTFTWDGKDAFGRLVHGTQQAIVRLGYAYTAVRLQPAEMERSFAALSYSGIPVSGTQTEIVLWEAWKTNLSILRWPTNDHLGGWSLDVLHSYDPESRTLLLGDGTLRSARVLGNVITTVVGGGRADVADGVPATDATLSYPSGIAFGEDGSLFIADWNHHRVRKVDPNGIITTIAGGGAGQITEGVPATSISINPIDVAMGASGSLFIADVGGRIWVVSRDGLIRTFAGGGTASPGDGGPATQAQLGCASSVAVGPDGAVFFTDSSRIRRVAPDGTISTVAGPGSSDADDIPAIRARVKNAGNYAKISVAQDGSIYVENYGSSRIRRIGTDGIIRTFAGTSNGFSGDGGPAKQAQLYDAWGAWPSSDGSVLIADRLNNRVRVVTPDGVINTLAGSGPSGGVCYQASGDGGPAILAATCAPWMAARGPDGNIYIADSYDNRIRRVELAFPRSALYVPSANGQELYEFDVKGRHLRTFDTTTGALRYTFGYDADGQLASVTDGDNNVTQIQPYILGNGFSIVAPGGQVTSVDIGDDGLVSSISNPATETTSFTYYAGGLLETLTDPRNYVHHFYYDALGKLTRDENPAGGFKSLTRSEADAKFTVDVTTALGRTSTYKVEALSTGDERRVNTAPDGTQIIEQRLTNATTTTSMPDGTTITTLLGPDPRFGMQAPVSSVTVGTPAGRSLSMSETRTATLSTPTDPLSATALGETITVNGRAYVSNYAAATRTWTSTTPTLRTITSTLDAKGKLAQVQPPGVSQISFSYDTAGRLSGSARLADIHSGLRQRRLLADDNRPAAAGGLVVVRPCGPGDDADPARQSNGELRVRCERQLDFGHTAGPARARLRLHVRRPRLKLHAPRRLRYRAPQHHI